MKKKLPGKIATLAQIDDAGAEMLAARGKLYSPLEEALCHFYQVHIRLAQIQQLDKRQAQLERASLQIECEKSRTILCTMFLDALAQLNADKLIQIAKAVKFFRGRYSGKSKENPDHLRADLLFWKQILTKGHRKFTSYSQAAECVGYRGNMDVFHRICNRLQIPVVKQAGGRPQNPDRYR
jgi:hypothetical protein